MAEFMRRFATGLDTYEFAEVRSEDAADFEEAVAFMLDHVGGGSATTKAVETVKKSFGNTSNVTKGGFGNKGAQQSQPEKVQLGEHDGYSITLYTKGKFGPYVNAYQKGANPERINANLPKGADPSQIDLPAAIEILNEAA
jgi:topoisomerase IA-like protein